MKKQTSTLVKKRSAAFGKHFLLAFISFIAVFPLYWMIISSFKNESEIFGAALLPSVPTFSNYIYAFQSMPIWQMLGNAIVMSIAITVGQLLTSLLAAYALTRWNFKGKKLIYGLLSLCWLIPVQAIMIPNYVTIVNMGLKENIIGIILPTIASAFAILNLYQVFEAFPKALIDAALIDGDSEWGILTRIILPNIKASVASLGILLFITAWNDYMWPMLVTSKLENAPIQIGLRAFVSSDTNMWGALMAATTVSCIPILILYLFMQRQIVDSFVKWGIK